MAVHRQIRGFAVYSRGGGGEGASLSLLRLRVGALRFLCLCCNIIIDLITLYDDLIVLCYLYLYCISLCK